ncbi:MAG TPA: hypothetical protein VFF52_04395 [Isosphaeraceae bacterium]|nr:hypothetical protein [Isosphaeraceae bacterium]
MGKITGQVLRLGGLFLELLGVIGVISEPAVLRDVGLRLPGGILVSPAWIAVALGFLAWLLGTYLLLASRPSRSCGPAEAPRPSGSSSALGTAGLTRAQQRSGESGPPDHRLPPAPDH